MAGRKKKRRTNTARRAKPRKRKCKRFTETEHLQLLADLTRAIKAWEEHAPNAKFAGMTVQQFRKAVQPSLDLRAEEARLDCEMVRLQKVLGEDSPDRPLRH